MKRLIASLILSSLILSCVMPTYVAAVDANVTDVTDIPDIDDIDEDLPTGADDVLFEDNVLNLLEDLTDVTTYTPTCTILRSVNHIVDAAYNPKLEDIPNLADKISEDKQIAIVYDGYFDVDYEEYVSSNASRAYEILGYDILFREESFIFPNSGKLTFDYHSTEATDVTADLAVMAIYKALNKNILASEYHSYANDVALTPDNSPLAGEITVPIDGVNIDDINITYVATTRTNIDAYWSRAYEQRVTTGFYESQHLTLGELCYLLDKVMYLYGEPVLTELEQSYLLEVYGRTLPYTLPSAQLSAVKNLMAKGIVLPEYDYYSEVSTDLLLEILMRAADPDSRETFKNIQITYDATLLSEGYYPTEAYALDTGIYVTDYNIDYSTAEYYDYFIKVLDGVTKFAHSDNVADNAHIDLIVQADSSQTYGSEMQGVRYFGIEEILGTSYYHLQIPVDTVTKSANGKTQDAVTSDGYLIINSYKEDDTPAYYKIKYGGGFYETAVDCSNSSQRIYSLDRVAFDDSHDVYYIDSNRKLQGIRDLTQDVELYDDDKGSYSVTVLIPDKMKDFVTFLTNGEYIPIGTLANSNPDKVTTSDGGANGTYYTFKGLGSASDIKQLLKVDCENVLNGTANVETYQVYGKLGTDMLVSANYLKARGAIKGFDWISSDILLLYSNTQNVYIDTSRHLIICGTTVYRVPDSTRLVYESGTETLIDYRAAMGWATDFLMITDINGVVTISEDVSTTRVVNATSVSSPFGSDLGYLSTTGKYDAGTAVANKSILLTGSYTHASYFVYRDYTSSVATDTLFALKIADPAYPIDDSAAREKFKALFGVEFSDDTYDLVFVNLKRSADAKQVVDGITYNARLGYLVQLERTTELEGDNAIYKDKDKYYYYIPLFQKSDVNASVIDYNFNMLKNNSTGAYESYGTMLGCYIDVTKYPTTDNKTPLVTVQQGSLDKSNTVTISDYEVIPAATGFSMFLMSPTKLTAKDAVNDDSAVFYYGTMQMTLYKSSGRDAVYMQFNGSTFKGAALKDNVFSVIFRRATGYTLKYSGIDYTIADSSYLNADIPDGTYYTPTNAKGSFDWENFSLKEMLTNVDDGLTIAIIFILNLLPRFFMAVFMLLICLAVIHDVPVWKRFCSRVFDPYKLITIGRQTVDTIKTNHIVIASIISLAAFGLFQNGVILDVISWIVRAVVGILNR